MKSFIVIGVGRFGSALIRTLFDMGYDVMAVDRNPEVIRDIAEFATEAVECDVRDENTLRALGLNNFDAAVVSIGNDLESSILATILLKEEGIPKIIAKAQTILHGRVLYRVGADKVVYPEREMGERVAHNLANSHIEDFFSLSEGHGLLEIHVLSAWIGRSLGEVKMRNKYHVNVVAIHRGKETIVNPTANMTMEKDDLLVVIGATENLNELERLIEEEETSHDQ